MKGLFGEAAEIELKNTATIGIATQRLDPVEILGGSCIVFTITSHRLFMTTNNAFGSELSVP